MIHQHVCIHNQLPWCIDILYDVKPKDADTVLSALSEMGCHPKHLYHAEDMLRSGIPNEGLTYSDKRNKRTLIIVGHATSIGEFISTVVHEVDHLTDHISQYYNIPYDSEENSYLIGDIAKTIYEDAVEKVAKYYNTIL